MRPEGRPEGCGGDLHLLSGAVNICLINRQNWRGQNFALSQLSLSSFLWPPLFSGAQGCHQNLFGGEKKPKCLHLLQVNISSIKNANGVLGCISVVEHQKKGDGGPTFHL